jgi:hypothetical protein
MIVIFIGCSAVVITAVMLLFVSTRRLRWAAAGLLAASCAFLWLAPGYAWRDGEVRRWAGFIPPAIELNGLATPLRERPGLLDGCGYVVFRLSDAARHNIERDGLGFLSAATVSRRPVWGKRPASYPMWKSTPVTSEDRSLHSMSGNCSPELNSELRLSISKARSSPGAFYTMTKDVAMLAVPSEQMLVVSYND